MPSGEDEKAATLDFLKSHFQRYYRETRPILPDRFGRREFGFMFWSAGLVVRHLGFSKEEDLWDFLASRVPAHAYHSSAYYETPDGPTMEEKGWLGADLVFDLDADHIPTAKEMSYAEMLEAVRLKIIKLYDEFLEGDFGFRKDKLRLVFSGGRGYHIHVFDERVWSLGSHERREIVDWITGKGFDAEAAFKESAFDSREFQGRVRVKKRLVAPDAEEPGWRGKIFRGMLELASKLEAMKREDALAFLLSFEGVKGHEAEDLLEALFKPRTTRPRVIRGVDRLREGQIEALPDKSRDLLIRVVRDLQQVRIDEYHGVPLEGITQRGETDEPVTSDIKRLIRMPGSLHGKSALAVVPLTRDSIEDFRPLRDAVPKVWTDESVSMRIANRINLEIRDEAFNLAPGVSSVPQFLALFLAARGLASVVREA